MARRVSLQIPSVKQTNSNITHFEDLSNELFYEFFDFFDDIYIYETFAYLNTRFHHLVTQSYLPLKFHLSYQSKANFQNRCQTIFLPNKHRLLSLRFSHHLLIEQFFLSFSLDSSCIRLESLNFDSIKADDLNILLTSFVQLPSLHFLKIQCIEKVRSTDTIYRSIFRLPVLKYCQLSLETFDDQFSLSFDDYDYSPLEHLIIHSKCNLNDLIVLLTYALNLTHLSCRLSTLNSSLPDMSLVPTNLTNISLQLEDTSFDEFEWFIASLSSQLRKLSISTKHDMEFLNADRWQRIITQRMPDLQKFSFEYHGRIYTTLGDNDQYYSLIAKFNSSFWCKKQWFFAHQHYQSNYSQSWIRFYSIKPYRWKRYQFDDDISPCQESGVNLATEVDLHSYQTLPYQFSRAHQLILSKGNIIFLNDLFQHFSHKQLTKLVIFDQQLRLEHLLSLIHHLPNLQLLTISPDILTLSSPQSETNRVIFHKNNIVKITIIHRCTLQDIQMLQRICPCSQSLDIEIENEQIEIIVRLLLSKRTTKNHQTFNTIRSTFCHSLSSICFREINYRMIDKLRTIIDRNNSLGNYSIEYFDQKIFLWW